MRAVRRRPFKHRLTFSIATLLLAIFPSSDTNAAVALDAVGQLLTSRGYGGAQLVHPDNFYRLPINTNGKAGHLVIDTGAPSALVYRESLRKFGLAETKTTEKVMGAFGSGRELFGITRFPSLAIGNWTLANVPAGVASDHGGVLRQYGSADGLFGLREMLKYGAVIDLNHRLIYLHPGGRSTAVSAAMKVMLISAGYTAVELTVADRHIHLSGAINGTPCRFLVDTGAYFTIVGHKIARTAKIGGSRTGLSAEGLGNSSGGEILGARFPSMKIGSYEIKNASAAIGHLDENILHSGGAAGLLGVEYLAKNSAIFDFNSGTLYLRPRGSR